MRIGSSAFGRGADSGVKSQFVEMDYDLSRTLHIYHVIGLSLQRVTPALTAENITGIFQELGSPI